jgi:ferrochelatase
MSNSNIYINKTGIKPSPENSVTAVLLANMGAPDSEQEMKVFLKRMFNDKAILYTPYLVRTFVSTLISNVRYKSSWKKYQQIGGSPLQNSMDKTAEELQQLLGSHCLVSSVYSYSKPFIHNKVSELYAQGIRHFEIISMYPQTSYSTTGSVQASLDSLKEKFHDIQFRFIEDYFDHPLFIAYWEKLISKKIKNENYQKPHLLFSAHAIPQSFVKRGDKYAQKMDKSAKLIAEALNLPYGLGYQSKIGPIEWTRPYTTDLLNELHSKGIDELIVVPLSFVNENLETRFDLDTELIPYAKNELKMEKICRIEIPLSDATLVKMFYSFIQK